MKKILALFLASVMISCSLASCGEKSKDTANNNNDREETTATEKAIKNPEERILGLWEAELDFSENISELTSDGDEELAKYLTVDGLKTTYTFDFDKEGNVKISVDEEAFQKKLETMREDIASGYTAYYEAMLKKDGFDMTVEEYFDETGITMEQLVDEALDSDSLLSAIGKLATVGKYRLEGERIFIDEEPMIYCFNSDTVLVFMLDVSQMTDEASLFFPITLMKK